MTTLATREAQALSVTEADREEGNEDNPIIYAESAPCRFESVTYFFPETDGVEIVQDIDNREEDPKVYYFNKEERVELTEGVLYEWAMERWEEA